VIEERAARLEGMRHRGAIDFHEDVVRKIVLLIPALQAREERAARHANRRNGAPFGPRGRRAEHIRVDDRFEQVLGKHRPAPHEPRLRAERQRRQPPFAARVRRDVASAGADRAPQRIDRRGSDARQRVGVRCVAGEQLVAAVARQADGDVFPCERGNVERGDG